MRSLITTIALTLCVLTPACARQAPYQDPTAAKPPAAARVATLPDCAGFEIQVETAGPVGCQSSTGFGLVRFTYAPSTAEDGDFVLTATLIGTADAPVQTFTLTQISRMFPPEVRDLNGDGGADLLVTTEVGNVNAVQTVYLFDSKAGQFVEAGEVSGTGLDRMPDGLLAVSSRSSAASYVVEFYRIDALKLVMVAEATVDFAASGKIESCTVAASEGNPKAFASLGLTPAQANTKFCGFAQAQFGP
jgi:hypothetical protein